MAFALPLPPVKYVAGVPSGPMKFQAAGALVVAVESWNRTLSAPVSGGWFAGCHAS